jgi:hypothetical protein
MRARLGAYAPPWTTADEFVDGGTGTARDLKSASDPETVREHLRA